MKTMKLLILALASLVGRPLRGETMMLANEKAKPNYKQMHAEAIGIAPDASDDDAVAAHSEHMQLANDMADDIDADMPNEKDKDKSKEGASKVEAPANDKIARAQKKAADLLIANALSEGRILPAAKGDWEGKFANDFDSAEADLQKERKKLHTDARTKDLSGANKLSLANESERRDRVESLIANEMEKNGGNYNLAFSTVQRAHKDLFGQMKKPEAKK